MVSHINFANNTKTMKEEKTENESEYYCDDFNDEDRVLK
jgi:hypothetical protein